MGYEDLQGVLKSLEGKKDSLKGLCGLKTRFKLVKTKSH